MSQGLELRLVVRRSETFQLGIELSIAPDETVALLGPNGAGKSTAVSAIAGLVPIESGRIALNDTVLDDPAAGTFVPPEERRIGVVFQDYLLFPHLSVQENVAFGLRSRGVSRREALSRAKASLRRLDLDGVGNLRSAELSGGQAQRAALARALVTDPDLFLLDEPLSALDVSTRTEVRRDLAAHLASFDGPRLLITHDPTEAFLLADRIQIIEDGAVTQTGTADDIWLRPRTAYAADLAGANFIFGEAAGGVVEIGAHSLHVADEVADGPVLVTIHPTAVSIHTHRPEGSPRNMWPTTVSQIERLGPRVRLRTGSPLALTAELTEAAREELSLRPGSEIWIAIKATEIGLQQDTEDGQR